MTFPTLRAAACHSSPIFLDAGKTTQKCIALIRQAAANGANLVVFPESYIPAFPIWSSDRAPTQNHAFFQRMVEESVYVDGKEVMAIREVAKEIRTIVSVGISEKVRYSTATLFNTNLIIGSNGDLLVHHRKLMPTFFEKLTWSPGDGHGLRIADTEYGKIGALICGENTNPLARYALMAVGEQVHISCWPALWPTRRAGPREVEDDSSAIPVADLPSYDNITANRTRAAAHCFEAKCFGILCAGHLSDEAIDKSMSEMSESDAAVTLKGASRAASMFLDPTGKLHPSFIIDENGVHKPTDMLQYDEGILYADLDLAACVEGKQYHDVVGGYQRFDVFDLQVDRRRRGPAVFIDGG